MKVQIEQPVFDAHAATQLMQVIKVALESEDVEQFINSLEARKENDLYLLSFGYGGSHAWVKQGSHLAGKRVLLITK